MVSKKGEGGEKKDLASIILELFPSNEVVIAARNGVIYQGKLVSKERNFLLLRDAKVTGSKYVATMDFLLVNMDIIQHIHSKPRSLTEKT